MSKVGTWEKCNSRKNQTDNWRIYRILVQPAHPFYSAYEELNHLTNNKTTMKVFGFHHVSSFGRMFCLAVLLMAATMPQQTHALNALVNYNEITMWMYNYFRAYLCDGLLPETLCDSLAGAEDDGSSGSFNSTANFEDLVTQRPNEATTAAQGDGDGAIFGWGIFEGGAFGGGRRRRQRRQFLRT